MKDLPPVGAKDRDITQAIRDLIRGRSNAVNRVTLTPSATETVVTQAENQNLNENAIVLLSPLTDNALAALPTTYGVIARVSGVLQVTFKHASAASTDRTFGYLVVGG